MTVAPLLEGKVVLVAGIGPGLGRSIACAASSEGAAVALVARTPATLEAVAAEIQAGGGQVISVAADVTRAADCERAAAAAVEAFGGVDTVVYNAFKSGNGARLADADLSEWRSVMEINAFGALELVKACLASLSARQGSVVLINSRQLRRPTNGAYAMSKAALMVVGQVLAHELGPSGVRVNSVVPGWMWAAPVQAHFEARSASGGPSVDEQYEAVARGFPLRRMPLADDVANAVIFLASERAAAITGQSIDVNAGEIFR